MEGSTEGTPLLVPAAATLEPIAWHVAVQAGPSARTRSVISQPPGAPYRRWRTHPPASDDEQGVRRNCSISTEAALHAGAVYASLTIGMDEYEQRPASDASGGSAAPVKAGVWTRAELTLAPDDHRSSRGTELAWGRRSVCRRER
jgi:hypothetical protein